MFSGSSASSSSSGAAINSDAHGAKTNGRKSRFSNPLFVFVLGAVGVIAPITSIFVMTFQRITVISRFNGTMLMFLSLLTMVFLVIKVINSFINRKPKLFLFSLILFAVVLISFLFNLSAFIVI